ncbi:MAG: ATP-dependent Clp protease proteolytic subunit [Candidatus Levybacteria bacterium]|nr:ATP-dependent Clp protease proteolytic subunit [Candidatus Levybacteria bacterium]
MYYFNLTGEIVASNAHDLIFYWHSKILDENYTGTITIYLSSIGGDIESAIRVYDFLKSTPNKIHTIGFGQIDSSAITIFLAGDKRTVLKNTRFRFHEPTYHIQQANSMLPFFEERIRLFQQLDRRLKEITSQETKKSMVQINKLYLEGKILNTADAKALNIVDEIVSELPKPTNLS